jgi:hypothetical protein
MTTLDVAPAARARPADWERPWHGEDVPPGIRAQLPSRDPTVALAVWLVVLVAIVLA